jgi:peptidoglycan/LPS O-acetylase OafA/YrhL
MRLGALQFRKDINGLRAIAVIAVVIFHFNPGWLSGGFAGVDVFFVISGYLMTKIILTKLENDSFSILDFYRARAQRIVPALAALCLVLLLFGWFYLTPKDYQELGKHISSSITFFSNIIYWREAGYFDLSSHKNWLLHTWSLSAEWQFYMVYPIVLVILQRILTSGMMKTSILLMTIIGFVASIYASSKWPNMSYYLLPTRAWEMLIGGLVYIYPLSLRINQKKVVEVIGLLMIIFSYVFISKDDIWPGYLAILPVLGAFLILQAQREGSFVTSNAVFQKIGAWSYSIYLWHWPFVVLKGYFHLGDHWIIPLMFIAVVMAYISYERIEKVKAPTLFLFTVTLVISLIVWNFKGIESRFDTQRSDTTLKQHLFEYGGEDFTNSGFIGKENSEILLVGDSFANQYFYGLQEENINAHYITNFGCLILPDITRFRRGQESDSCSAMYQKVLDYIKHNNIQTIIFSASWADGSTRSGYKGGEAINFHNDDIAAKFITEQLSKMMDEIGTDKNYFIISDTQGDKLSTGECLYKSQYFSQVCQEFSTKKYNSMTNYFIKESKLKDNVTLINPNNYFCDISQCRLIEDGYPIYFDQTHFSKYGSSQVAPYIKEQLINFGVIKEN